MANYYATARTNYFKVKDLDAFKEWLKSVRMNDLSLIEDADTGRVGINATCGDCAGWMLNYEDDDGEEHDLLAELAEHLTEGEVAILVEAGAEKVRYVHGFAMAVNHKGEVLRVMISDIYELVEKTWGVNASEATY